MAIQWTPLESVEQLHEIKLLSETTPCVIIKHSTRCSISAVALERLNGTPAPSTNAHYFYLDLLKFRPVSNSVAEQFQIHHESPQVLLISNGECVYEETHLGIDPVELQSEINKYLQ